MGLRRENRLLKRPDFVRTYEQGRQVRGGFLHMFILDRGDDAPVRFGFTVTKRFGGSVTRNRIRRQFRECARQALPLVTPGCDIVINVRSDAQGRMMAELQSRFIDCLRRAQVLRQDS